MDEVKGDQTKGVSFKMIKRDRPLFKEVVKQIESGIITGTLQPGNMLPPERVLAEQFGVSRTVIREAMKALEHQGLVEVQHGRGIMIISPSVESVVNSMVRYLKIDMSPLWALHEMRSIVETEIAGLAASRRATEDVQILKNLLEQMANNVNSPEKYAEIDIEFHRALARMTYNPLFPIIMEPLSEFMREARRIGGKAMDAQRRTLASHSEIVSAVENQDIEYAKSVMGEHFEKVASFISEAESKDEIVHRE